MFDKTPPISDLQLDRYLSGELSPAEAAALRRALARDPEATARLAALEAARAAFDEDPPWLDMKSDGNEAAEGPEPSGEVVSFPEPTAEDFARAAEDFAEPTVPGTWRRAVGVMIAAAAAISLVALIPGASETGPGMDTTRAKGAAGGLDLVVVRGDRTFSASGQLQVQAGDVLQPVLTAEQARQVAVIGEDAEGISPWLHDGGRTVTVAPGTMVELPASFTVDEAFRGTVHGFVCEGPTSVEALTARVSGGPAVDGCREARWVLQP